MGKGYSHVIWDWNGTLFDDAAWCVEVINALLNKRGINTIDSIDKYRNVFRFPVIEYYRDIGFDLDAEPFEDIAEEYIKLYHSGNSGNCQLFPQTSTVLSAIKSEGIAQVILSASETQNLMLQINEFDILGYFDSILGQSDIYAKSKQEVGLDYIRNERVAKAVLIGDTVHDYEVARALGIDCILICNGHQHRDILRTCNVPILNDIADVPKFLYD